MIAIRKCEFCGNEVLNYGSIGRHLFACSNNNLMTSTIYCVSHSDRPQYFDRFLAMSEYETRVSRARVAKRQAEKDKCRQ